MHCYTRTSLDLRNKWNLLFIAMYSYRLTWLRHCIYSVIQPYRSSSVGYHEWVNKRYINETHKWKLQGKLPGCTEGQWRKSKFSSQNAYIQYFAGLSRKLTLFIKINNFAFHNYVKECLYHILSLSWHKCGRPFFLFEAPKHFFLLFKFSGHWWSSKSCVWKLKQND